MKWDMILLSEKASYYCYNAMVTAKEGQVRMQYSHRCKDSNDRMASLLKSHGGVKEFLAGEVRKGLLVVV